MNAEQKLIFEVLLSNDEELKPSTYIGVEDKHHVRYLIMKHLAKKIIQAFPQIEKKPVIIETGDSEEDDYGRVSTKIMVYANKKFDNNAQREEWIENHYVEFAKHYYVAFGQKAVDQCGYCERDIRHPIHHHEGIK